MQTTTFNRVFPLCTVYCSSLRLGEDFGTGEKMKDDCQIPYTLAQGSRMDAPMNSAADASLSKEFERDNSGNL
jgi:hypothetical protein